MIWASLRAIDGENPDQQFFWEVKAVRADVPGLQVERDKARNNDVAAVGG
jgi:hypothetical protein